MPTLRDNPIFGVLADGVVERVEARPGEPVETAGLTLELVPVPGKAPLYREGADPAIGSEAGEATAVIARARADDARLCAGLRRADAGLAERLGTADILLFDGTLWRDDEMIAAGVGTKTGRRMGHMPIAGPGGSLAAFAGLPARRKIFIHINNTNPILVADSPERAAVEAAGWEVGLRRHGDSPVSAGCLTPDELEQRLRGDRRRALPRQASVPRAAARRRAAPRRRSRPGR